MISAEIALFFLIIAFASVAIYFSTKAAFVDSLFHVVSMASSTGYDYLNIMSLNGTAVSIFITLILIGGCTFSMAGGIRIARLVSLAKSVKDSIKGIFIKEQAFTKSFKRPTSNLSEYVPALISILLFIAFLVVFAILFTTMGVSFSDSIFEVGSALSTNGVSMGATTVTMPIAYKWLMVVAMTIGRVEILTIIIALIPSKIIEQSD
jgi:trk system potassium uptake protein TrkH